MATKQQKTSQKAQKLTLKEREFVQKFVRENDENGTKTVKEVFSVESDEYAALKAHRLIRKDNVSQAIEIEKESLKSALIKQGITPDKIAEKVNVLLNGVDPQGNTDYTAVDKGLKHATNIYGVEEPEKQKGTIYNFILNPTFKQQIQPLEEALKEQFKNVKAPETTE